MLNMFLDSFFSAVVNLRRPLCYPCIPPNLECTDLLAFLLISHKDPVYPGSHPRLQAPPILSHGLLFPAQVSLHSLQSVPYLPGKHSGERCKAKRQAKIILYFYQRFDCITVSRTSTVTLVLTVSTGNKNIEY